MAEQITSPGTLCANQYVVKRGDSFYLISHRLGVPLRALLEANANINPARLMVGDILCIPYEALDEAAQQPAQITIDNQSTTKPTETITIEPDQTTEPAEEAPIKEETPTPEPEPPTAPPCPESVQVTVQQGQTIADIQLTHNINLHTLEIANPDTDLTDLTAGQILCVPANSLACAMPDTYCMQNGDTLESVSLKYNLPISALLRANPCLAPADFTAGASIALPK